MASFVFIKTDTTLSKKPDALKTIIMDANDNITDFVKTHEYFGVLSHLLY